MWASDLLLCVVLLVFWLSTSLRKGPFYCLPYYVFVKNTRRIVGSSILKSRFFHAIEILFIHYEICRLELGIPRLNLDIIMVSIFVLMSAHIVCLVGWTILKITNTLRLHYLGCCKNTNYFGPSNCDLHQWLVTLWSTGLVYLI